MNKIKMTNNEIGIAVFERNGLKIQVFQFIEELSELLGKLNRHSRPERNEPLVSIAEEFADIEIMLNQFQNKGLFTSTDDIIMIISYHQAIGQLLDIQIKLLSLNENIISIALNNLVNSLDSIKRIVLFEENTKLNDFSKINMNTFAKIISKQKQKKYKKMEGYLKEWK